MSVYQPITYDRMFWAIPKACVNFDGNGNIKKSYNINSIQKVSTGIFVINFFQNMDDANYLINITLNSSTQLICGMVATQLINSCTINIRGGTDGGSTNVSSKLIDPNNVYCMIL